MGRRGRPLPTSGGDGYDVTGPHGLLDSFKISESEDDVVRAVLRHIEAGKPGPVYLQI